MRPTDQDISNSRFTQLVKAHLYDNQIDLSLGLSSNLNLGVSLISSIQESGQLHCELYVFHLASSGPLEVIFYILSASWIARNAFF